MSVPRRRNRIGRQFAARPIEMMESPAFQALSLTGHRILARIEIELAHHGGNDNGKLPVTYEHFSEFGIDRHAIAPALREVCALGFAEITEQGRGGNAEWRRPNLFRLTYRNVGNAQPTDEWRRIRTEHDALVIARAARKASTGKKRKASGGARQFSVEETCTENPKVQGGKSPLHGGVAKPTPPQDSRVSATALSSPPTRENTEPTETLMAKKPDGGNHHHDDDDPAGLN